jgi:hypothetical protein
LAISENATPAISNTNILIKTYTDIVINIWKFIVAKNARKRKLKSDYFRGN